MTDTFQGPVRVLGSDGILLTTGMVNLETDPDMGGWKGTLEMLRGTAVAGKALVVDLEVPGNGRGRAQLTPEGTNGEKAISEVTSLGGGTPFWLGEDPL
ncbi:MAG TPA: hypothetical protein VFV13_10480 [Acidimicrobiia bacterium]|nr:hypothetical protein [Acidimicrobiia bacterium]